MNYPHVRSSKVCPLCLVSKAAGLIVCWSCYGIWNLRHGNAKAEALINQAESELDEQPAMPAGPLGSLDVLPLT